MIHLDVKERGIAFLKRSSTSKKANVNVLQDMGLSFTFRGTLFHQDINEAPFVSKVYDVRPVIAYRVPKTGVPIMGVQYLLQNPRTGNRAWTKSIPLPQLHQFKSK